MKALNKQARRNYTVEDSLEVGIMLTGAEAKAARAGRIDLNKSYAKIIRGELFAVNIAIHVPGEEGEIITRSRKLLLHKKELLKLSLLVKQGKLTLIPLKMYNTRRLIKLELGVCKSKRKVDKRAQLKKRVVNRQIERELKER